MRKGRPFAGFPFFRESGRRSGDTVYSARWTRAIIISRSLRIFFSGILWKMRFYNSGSLLIFFAAEMTIL